jgi:hypothetical protein
MEAADVWDLVVEMTPSVSIPQLGSEFDDFLFAPVGGESNGMMVSVLSALARLDLDPWEEAAKLARLPGETAIERLTSLLAILPGGLCADPDPGTIAARLIALLPRRTALSIASPKTRPNAGTATNFPTITRLVVINVLFVAFMLGAQWIVANNQPPTQVTDDHVPTPDAHAAQVPSPTSDQ